MKRKLTLLCLIVFVCSVSAAIGQITFKVPEGFPVDWKDNGFKGWLFLQKDSPSGLFIVNPDDGETVAQLRERAASKITSMFASEVKDLKSVPFEITAIASHPGDVENGSKQYLYKGDKEMVQILFFERATVTFSVVYGYFARRKNDESKSKIWVGEDMKKPKVFTKFVESLGKEK